MPKDRMFRSLARGAYPDISKRECIPTPVAVHIASIPADHIIYRTVFPAKGVIQDFTLEVEAIHEEPLTAVFEFWGNGISVATTFPLRKGENHIELPPSVARGDKLIISINGIATGFWLSYIYDMD